MKFISPTPEATEQFGASLVPLLRPGDTVVLSGDLGAGKTTLVRGLARALGVEGPVTSPTFVLLHSYPTKAGFDLLHADVWRLEQLQEVIDLAIPELLEEGAVAVVEWGERAAPALASDHLHVDIGFDEPAPLPATGRASPASQRNGGTRRREGVPDKSASFEAVSPQGPRWLEVYGTSSGWQDRLANFRGAPT